MREIKFRAFSDKRNRYIDMYWDFDIVDGVLIYEQRSALSDKKELAIEQYTGLKDKNGVEIYEGDLIEAKNATYKVAWFNTAFWVEPVLGYGNSQPISKLYDYEENNIYRLKVIGNIHENPELLEVD